MIQRCLCQCQDLHLLTIYRDMTRTEANKARYKNMKYRAKKVVTKAMKAAGAERAERASEQGI